MTPPDEGFHTTVTERERAPDGRLYTAIYRAVGPEDAPVKGELIGYEEIKPWRADIQKAVKRLLSLGTPKE